MRVGFREGVEMCFGGFCVLFFGCFCVLGIFGSGGVWEEVLVGGGDERGVLGYFSCFGLVFFF